MGDSVTDDGIPYFIYFVVELLTDSYIGYRAPCLKISASIPYFPTFRKPNIAVSHVHLFITGAKRPIHIVNIPDGIKSPPTALLLGLLRNLEFLIGNSLCCNFGTRIISPF